MYLNDIEIKDEFITSYSIKKKQIVNGIVDYEYDIAIQIYFHRNINIHEIIRGDLPLVLKDYNFTQSIRYITTNKYFSPNSCGYNIYVTDAHFELIHYLEKLYIRSHNYLDISKYIYKNNLDYFTVFSVDYDYTERKIKSIKEVLKLCSKNIEFISHFTENINYLNISFRDINNNRKITHEPQYKYLHRIGEYKIFNDDFIIEFGSGYYLYNTDNNKIYPHNMYKNLYLTQNCIQYLKLCRGMNNI